MSVKLVVDNTKKFNSLDLSESEIDEIGNHIKCIGETWDKDNPLFDDLLVHYIQILKKSEKTDNARSKGMYE
jgi:hypothetical protein